MSVALALLFDPDPSENTRLRWPLRLAALHGGDLTIVILAGRAAKKSTTLDLGNEKADSDRERAIADWVRRALDRELTPGGWEPASKSLRAQERRDDGPVGVTLKLAPAEQLVAKVASVADDPQRDLLVAVIDESSRGEDDRDTLRRQLVRAVSCRAVGVALGRRQMNGELLLAVTPSSHSRAATRLASALARRHERVLTGLWIEPQIGPEARGVGRRLLRRMLRDAVDREESDIVERVEVDDRPERGILRVCEDERYEAVIMGASKLGGSGLSTLSVPIRVVRGTDQTTAIIVRASVPRRTRLLRFLDGRLRRRVPQLAREERADFVTRVQSNSQWNFDFVSMMGLSTVIASLGLLANSPAVIIGAMLVAPLMTPLLGLGLALVQDNPWLARMTARTTLLGFLFAFVLALAIGVLDTEYHVATSEMYRRHWPTLLDLGIAFVSGLAAAYASGRPGLLAALPGVAIAASLLPPVAASGLALSVGHFDLALGALLLFTVNTVAIVLASALVLYAVGVRAQRAQTPTRRFGLAIFFLAAGLSFYVSITPAGATNPPRGLVVAIEEALGQGQRLRLVRLKRELDGKVVQIDLGGSRSPDEALGERFLEIARHHLGGKVSIRVSYRFEMIKPPPEGHSLPPPLPSD